MRTYRLLVLTLVMAMTGPGCDDDHNPAASGGGAGSGGGGGGDLSVPDAGVIEHSCKHIDIVISVDGSGSMQEELSAMRDVVFPAFAQRLPNISSGLDDFRVGTIDACPSPADFHTRGAGSECNFAGGNRWIESSSPNLTAEFSCVGDIYQSDAGCTGNNDDEQPASAAAASLEQPFVDGLNAGFSREKALLVVVAITDEDEQPTTGAGTAADVYDRLVATKGDVKRMVFLGIGGSSDCDGTYGVAHEATKLKAITNLFIAESRGVFWDLCDGNLANGLERAFATIEEACEELPPPCVDDYDCPTGEFCGEQGACFPYVE